MVEAAGRTTAALSSVSKAPANPNGERLGTILNDTYRIERVIANGGMGQVYEVVHLRLQQRFACKILEHQAARNGEAYARFRQEAEIAASLNHGSIVQVFDFNSDDCGNPYMVMELIHGLTLGDYVRQNPPSLRDVLRLFDPLCSALDAAHQAGIVHRDLKPSNIMVNRTESGRLEVKLLDFGISKMRDADRDMTRDNVVMGTPNYMSPEQARGQAGSAAATTDIFALGAILYETLAGRRAFDGDSTPDLLHRIVYEEPVPLVTLSPEVSAGLCRVVDRCLRKAPEDRYASVRALVTELRAAIRPRSLRAPQKSVAAGSLSHRRSALFPWLTAIFGLVVGSMVGIVGVPAQRHNVVDIPDAAPVQAVPPRRVNRGGTAGHRLGADVVTSGAKILELPPALYRGDSRGLTVWSDLEATPQTRALPSASAVTTLVASAAGDLWVGQADGTVSRWAREAHKPVWQRRFGDQPITALAAGADYLALGTASDLQLWNSATGRLLKRFRTTDPAVALVFTHDGGHRLWVIRRHEIEVIDADRRRGGGRAAVTDPVVRARLVADPAGGSPEMELDVAVGDWDVRRRIRLEGGHQGAEPRLEILETIRK